jgi:hypothetical protein
LGRPNARSRNPQNCEKGQAGAPKKAVKSRA